MDLEWSFSLALMLIEQQIGNQLRAGSDEIDRTVARHRAWILHWPNEVPNINRSVGQILRHMRRRNGTHP